MNIYTVIILAAILGEFALRAAAELLNVRASRQELPEEFQDTYDEARYRQAQNYLRARTRFGFVSESSNLAVLLGFWFTGGFQLLDGWLRTLAWPPLLTGVVYVSTVAAAHAALSLPFSIYSTFVIESRFGFNKTTPATFWLDWIKSLMLALLLGLPLLTAVIALFQHAGAGAWIYVWATAAGLSLLVAFVAPVWILPLFNTFTPVQDGELRTAVLGYAATVDFLIEGLYIMDASKRSAKSNAFFTGFGKHRRIVLFDTLVADHTIPEVVAVLAHEIGHWKKKHVLKHMAAGIGRMGVLFFLLSLFLAWPPLFTAFAVETPSVYTGLLLFSVCYAPVEFVLGIPMYALSRRHEYQADQFAVDTHADAQALKTALKKLTARNLGNLTPHPFFVWLNYSHPPVLQRIRRLTSSRA